MKSILRCMSPWEMNTQSGETLLFENCKGGYFSTLDEYGLRVTGAMSQEGTPTPDNPVPIQCVRAGTKVQCCGKNLLSFLSGDAYQQINNVCTSEINENAGSVTITSTKSNTTVSAQHTRRFYAKPYIGLTMTFSYGDFSTSMPNTSYPVIFIVQYNSSGASISEHAIYLRSKLSVTFDIAQDAYSLLLIVRLDQRTQQTIGDTLTVNGIQLEIGSVATPFEPYISNEITTPCDLYEGDVWYPTSGRVERNKQYRIFTGTEVWNDTQFTGCYSTNVTPAHSRYLNGGTVYSNILVGGQTSQPSISQRNGKIILATSSGMVGFGCKSVFATTAEWNSYLAAQYAAGTPVYIVYDLETSIIEQYAPQPIFAPHGLVNVLQTPTDLTAQLNATMMVRKQRADIWQYFYDGFVNDIEWGCNNILPLPSSEYGGEASLAYVGDGYMRLRIMNRSTTNTRYAHLITANPVTIPSGATKLCIRGAGFGSGYPQIRFGLFPPNAPDSNTTSNGGVQSPLLTINGTYTTQTLNLPEGYAGSSNYHIVIAARGAADKDRYYRITRVWFE